MKNWIVALMFCGGAATLGTGCLLYNDDGTNDVTEDVDGDGASDSGFFKVSWNLLSGDANAPTACPAELDAFQVVTLDQFDKMYVDYFQCADGAGLVEKLPDGNYSVYINMLDKDDNLLAQSGVEADVVLDGRQADPIELEFNFSIDRGSFELSWQLKEGESTTTCADKSISEIAVASTLVGENNEAVNDTFTCADGSAATPGLPLGTYTIAMSLRDDETPVGTAVEREATLDHGNQFQTIDTFVFDLAQ